MGAELVTAVSGEISGRDIEHGLGAGHALVIHAERRSRAREQDGTGELGVGVELEAVLDDVLVLAVDACCAGTEYEAAVVQLAVVSCELFLRDEVYCRVVISEVVGHLLDRLLDESLVCAFLGNNETLSCVLLSCCECGVGTGSYGIESLGYGDSVLLAVLNAGDSSDSIGVTL